jgi:hypothetical protein
MNRGDNIKVDFKEIGRDVGDNSAQEGKGPCGLVNDNMEHPD